MSAFLQGAYVMISNGRQPAFLRATAPTLTGVLTLGLLLGGCTKLGPDFVKPEAEVREEWVETGEKELRAEPVDYRDWWQVFDDPVLSELVETAYRQNLNLQVAGLRVLEARAQLGIAVGSLYPQTQRATGEATANGISKAAANTAAGQSSFINYGLGASVAWELDFWGRFRRGVESADASLYSFIANYDDVLVVLVGDVASNYVNVRTFQERIALAKQNVKIQQRSLEIADVRFKNGVVTELDVQQALSLLRETQSTVPALEIGLRQSENALSTLLGRPPGEVREILKGPAKIPVAPAEVGVGMPADLLRRRPDVRQAELQAAAQSARIGVARTDLFPRLSLLGSIGTNAAARAGDSTKTGDDGAGNLFTSDSLSYVAGPSFTWNIFNYGRLKNNVRVEDAVFQQAAVNYQNTVLNAAREVENAMVDFLRSQDQVKFLGDSVTASKRSVDLSLIQYRDGVTDFQRVLDTQRALVSTQDSWTETRGNIALSLVEMYRALGGGWELREGRPFVPESLTETMAERTDWGRLLKPDAVDKVPPPEEARDKWWWSPDW